MAMCAITVVAAVPFLSSSHYRRIFAQAGTIITQNDCRILQSCHMDDGATREEEAQEVIDQKPPERESEWVQANRKELVERIERVMHEDGTKEPLQGLALSRFSEPTAPLPGVFEPAVCMI